MMQNNLWIKNCLFVLVFLSFFCSMYPWFVWNNYGQVVVSVATCVCAGIYFFSNNDCSRKFPVFFVIILVSFMMWYCRNYNVVGVIINLFELATIVILFFQSRQWKIDLLHFITKWFSLFLMISLFAFVLNLVGFFPISPSKIQMGNHYMSLNYYLFITPLQILSDYLVRFCSVFVEPGHMVLGTTLLIMANRFDLKNKYVLIMVVVNLFSFSLAAYITMFIGFVLYSSSIKRVKNIAIVIPVIIAGLLTLAFTNSEDNLDHYIWDRLEYSSEKGIQGNNRNTAKYNAVYEMTLSRPDLLLFGNDEYDTQNYYGGNAGYKKYIVENGLIGVILLLCFYLFAPFYYKTRDLAFFSFIIILLLMQDAYPFWQCVVFTYVLGTANLSVDDSVLKKS